MRRFLLLHGPNLNMLGIREPEVYGRMTLAELERRVIDFSAAREVHVDCFQSNHEGVLIDRIHAARGVYDAIVFNPGAYTHSSYALRDALSSIDVPTVEVHISDVDSREPFRAISLIAPACVAQIKGKGVDGYLEAIEGLLGGWSTCLGEGFELARSGKTIVGGEGACGDDPVVGPTSASEGVSYGANREESAARAFDSDVLGARLKRLRDEMARRGIDAAVLRDTSDIRWVTGFDGVFDDESCHALLVTVDDAVLHTDSRYATACRVASEGGLVRVDDSRASHAEFVRRALPEGVVSVGVEDSLSVREFRRFEEEAASSKRFLLKEQPAFVVGLRAVKDDAEVARMKAAQAIVDAAFDHIVGFMRPGMTEREVQIELEGYLVRNGAEGLAFPSIVAAGPNAANPHAIPGDTLIERGQCVVLDFGARAAGYCSDMTRTVFIGKPSGRMLAAWETLRRANEAVEAELRAGVTGAEMHELAERVLADGGFGSLMGHGLGHGVGIDIHEEPSLSPRNVRTLPEGAVVTVEPGIYVPGEFGMRLEDFGVVTKDGFEVFTKSTHDIVII